MLGCPLPGMMLLDGPGPCGGQRARSGQHTGWVQELRSDNQAGNMIRLARSTSQLKTVGQADISAVIEDEHLTGIGFDDSTCS